MSETGDMWREYREYKQHRKAVYSANFYTKILPMIKQKLNKAGIEYKQFDEHHFRLFKNNVTVDYWPITGTWKDSHLNKDGCQLNGLLKHFEDYCNDIMDGLKTKNNDDTLMEFI